MWTVKEKEINLYNQGFFVVVFKQNEDLGYFLGSANATFAFLTFLIFANGVLVI